VTAIFIRAQKLYSIGYKQERKITKGKEHSHLEIAKANCGKWLGQATSLKFTFITIKKLIIAFQE